jgi:uncharacterized membrane protein
MRYSSIDLLRTFAIVVMVFVHFLENLSGVTPLIAGLGAPLFMFLSGISYRLWLNGQYRRSTSETRISQITVRRGLFLIGLGFVFNVFVWLPEDTFNWDVLTLIGSGVIAMNVARNLPSSITLFACAIIYLISPMARNLVDWPAYWTEHYYDPDLTLTDTLVGYLVTGYFPILPWIIYPLIGFVTGTLVFEPAHDDSRAAATLRGGMFAGVTLLGIASVAIVVRYLAADLSPVIMPKAWSMFPPSMEYVAATIGFCLLGFCGLHDRIDRRMPESWWANIRSLAAVFSRHSLTIYLLHHLVHVWPLWIYGLMMGQEPTEYWGQATTPAVAMALATLFLAGSLPMVKWFEKSDMRSVEAWMRWLCD